MGGNCHFDNHMWYKQHHPCILTLKGSSVIRPIISSHYSVCLPCKLIELYTRLVNTIIKSILIDTLRVSSDSSYTNINTNVNVNTNVNMW